MNACNSISIAFDFEFICNLLQSAIHGIPGDNPEEGVIGYPYYRVATILLSMKYWKKKHRNYFIRYHHEKIHNLIDDVCQHLIMELIEEESEDDANALRIIVEML